LPLLSTTWYFGCSTLLTIGPHKAAASKVTPAMPMIHHMYFFRIGSLGFGITARSGLQVERTVI
jgi:hypothetical protein